MSRIPYDIIAPEANRLYLKMTTAPDAEIAFWYEAYIDVLEAAGWDRKSFDRETQKRIDDGWEDTKPIIWN